MSDGFGRGTNSDGVHLAANLSLVVSESSSSVSETSTVQHLYLQGMRALIKYQPNHVLNYIETVVDKLLKVRKFMSVFNSIFGEILIFSLTSCAKEISL